MSRSREFSDSKRTLIKSAVGIAGLAAAGGVVSAVGTPREAFGQLLEAGIREDSMLAKVKKQGVLRVGYSQTLPWFQRDAKTGQLDGIYWEVSERLAKELEVKTQYQEVSWANSTVGLRKGDFDVFGSSLFYTTPRALVVNYVGPMWRKGRLVVTHKDWAERFKGPDDFNRADVIFSVIGGTSEEDWIKKSFPKAQILASTGQIAIALEPVRTKRAQLFAAGDLDALLYAKRNPWAHVINPDKPIGMTPNTWAIRYGDPEWKDFLDFWGEHMLTSGTMQELYDKYVQKMLA
jgi:polar amino acid transport system substrate-binding protein